jgi:Flp pilus assembly protein TadD
MSHVRTFALAFVALLPLTLRADAPPTAALQAYRAGQAALAREDFLEAEQEFRTAIREDRLFSIAYYGLGTAQAATRRYTEALESFRQAIDVHREWLARQFTDAVKVDQQRDDEIQDLQDSIRAINNGKVKYKSSQEVILLEQRIEQLRREKALEKTAATGSVPAEFYVALGSTHHRLGHRDQARAAYEEALKVDPGRGEAHNNLAAMALLGGEVESAREHVRQAEASGFRVNPDLKRDVELGVPAAAAAALVPEPAAEPSLAIEHLPLACAVAGRSPRIEARVTGTDVPASVRVRFSSAGSSYRYTVRMHAEGDRWVTHLPRPKRGLASFTYAIDATDNDAASARTDEVTVPVRPPRVRRMRARRPPRRSWSRYRPARRPSRPCPTASAARE